MSLYDTGGLIAFKGFDWKSSYQNYQKDETGQFNPSGKTKAISTSNLLGQTTTQFTDQTEIMYSPSTQTTSSSQLTTTETYSPTKTYAPTYAISYGAGGSTAGGASVMPSTSTDIGASQETSPSLVSKPSQAQSAEQGATQGMTSPIEGLIILAVLAGGGYLLVKSGALKKLGKKVKK